MSSLRNFKNEADEIMKDINISSELKEKTLMKIGNRKNRFVKAPMLSAACLVVVLAVVTLWKFPSITQAPGTQTGNENIQNAAVLTAPNNTTLPDSSDNNPATSMGPVVSNDFETIEEAKQFMGSKALEPAYVPDGFKLRGIQGVSNDDSNVRNIWLEYISGDRTFVISIEQNSPWGSFEGYKSIDISGMEGHIKSYEDSSFEASELRWFNGKDLYTVEGGISGEEALKIAKSLK